MSVGSRSRLFLCAIVLFCVHLAVLSQSTFAYGMDGYYYAAQVKSFWEKGRFFSKDISPILYAMTYFSRLGTDIVFMNKLFTSLLAALMVYPAWLFARNLMPQRNAVFAAVLLSTSVLGALFKLTFIKNYGALIFLLLFLNSLFRLQDGKNRQIFPATLWFILCLLSHKLTAGVAVLVLALHLMLYSRHRLISALVLSIGSALFLFYAQYFANVLQRADFVLLTELFSPAPVLPPMAFARSFISLRWIAFESWIYFLCSLAGILSLARLLVLRRIRPGGRLGRRYIILAFLFLLAANPFYNYSTAELGFRLYLLLLIPGTVFVTLMLKWLRPVRFVHSVAFRRVIPVLLSGWLLLGYLPLSLASMQHSDQIDYRTIEQVIDQINLPQDHLLIVHQGFDYYYCYRGRGDAFHFLPEKKHADRPVYRMAYGITDRHWDDGGFFSGNTQVQRLSVQYTLMPEQTWNRFLSTLSVREKKALLTWRNPHHSRAPYMKARDKHVRG